MMLSEFLFSGKGRVSRRQIWLWYFLPYLAISILAGMIDRSVLGAQPGSPGPLGGALMFAALWPTVAIQAKRFHDRSLSGWWVLHFMLAQMSCLMMAILPYVSGVDFTVAEPVLAEPSGVMRLASLIGFVGFAGFVVAQFVLLYVSPGRTGPNRYGDDPLATSSST